MRVFITKLSFFIVIIVMAWGGVEWFYRCVPNIYSYKNKIVQLNYNNCKVLILGNSHTYYGLNPDDFKEAAFNLANVSQTLLFDGILLNKHIAYFKKLECVVIPVEYSSLTAQDDHPDLEWRKYFYSEQMHLNMPGVHALNARSLSLALAPQFSFTVSNIRRYAKEGTLADCSLKGWGRYNGVNPKMNNPLAGKTVAQRHEDGLMDFSKNLGRLKNMLVVCREKNIKVILVTMPVTSYYRDNIDNKKLTAIVRECNVLANREEVSYLNLFDDTRFTNDDFYDADHLNATGAKKCSRIVDATIQ